MLWTGLVVLGTLSAGSSVMRKVLVYRTLIIPGEQLTAIKEAPLLLKPVRWCSFKMGSPLLLSSKIEVARLPLLNVSSVVLSQAV